MPDWWLIDDGDQEELAAHINDAAARVVPNLDSHGSEDRLTGALGQELIREPITLGSGTKVTLRYRGLSSQTEEPHAGGDGGILVEVRLPDGTIHTKGSLFQAKLLPGWERGRELSLPSREKAEKFHKQLGDMLGQTPESVGVFYTRRNVYVMDAGRLREQEIDDLRRPLADGRIVTLGTYLGKWVARCTHGDPRPDLVRRIREKDGFRHVLEMNVRAARPPKSRRHRPTWEGDPRDAWPRSGRR